MEDYELSTSAHEPISLAKVWQDLYFGNGKPGLTTRMALVEDSTARIEKKLDTQTKLLLAAVLTLVVDIIVRFVK